MGQSNSGDRGLARQHKFVYENMKGKGSGFVRKLRGAGYSNRKIRRALQQEHWGVRKPNAHVLERHYRAARNAGVVSGRVRRRRYKK